MQESRSEKKREYKQCKISMNLQKYVISNITDNESNKPCAAAALILSKKQFKLSVTDDGCNVQKNAKCQSDISEVLE
jgi:hypothetical protein